MTDQSKADPIREALVMARKRIEYLGSLGNERHQKGNEDQFFPVIDAALALPQPATVDRTSARDMLRSCCSAGGDLGCSCADQNYQWFGTSCESRMANAFKKLLETATVDPSGEMVLHPLSDIRDLHEVVHELGIEDSSTTPAEAVRELKSEIDSLHTALAGTAPVPIKALEHIRLHLLNEYQMDLYKAKFPELEAALEAVGKGTE